MPTTEVIILRKTPWQEGSLMVTGLSAASGRVDLKIRDGKSLGAKAFPAIDLFRVLEVEYRHADGGLQPLIRADLLRDHDRIVACPAHYLTACQIAAFILRHAQAQLPAPRLYHSLGRALAGLLAPATADQPGPGWFAMTRLVFLAEHGLLDAEGVPGEDRARRQQRQLLAQVLTVAEGGSLSLPTATPAYWESFRDWVELLCRHHGLS